MQKALGPDPRSSGTSSKNQRRCNRNHLKNYLFKINTSIGRKSSTVITRRAVHGKYPYWPTSPHFNKSQNIAHQPFSTYWIICVITFLTQSKIPDFLLTEFHLKSYILKSVAQADKAFREFITFIQTSYKPKLVKIKTKIFVLNKDLARLDYFLNGSIR
jgi:hypothetical protein